MDAIEELLVDAETRQRLARHVAGEAPAGLLRSLKVKLLSTCNLRCIMCRYWRIPRRALPLDLVRQVLDDAVVLGCRKIHLSGGEVTLYPDLEAVIAHAVARGLRTNLTTNAVLLDRARARRWIEAGVHAVSISLDGACAATHDAIRGVGGAFDQAVKGARNLQRENARRGSRVRLRINSVVQRRNLLEMPELIGLAAELGACDVVPMPVDGASADRPGLEELLHYQTEVAPRVLDRRRKFGLPTFAERIYPFGWTEPDRVHAARGHYALGYYAQHLCYAPYLHTFVSHLGEVFACCMTAGRMPPLGNVHHQRLEAIFTGPTYERFRQEMKQRRLALCHHCDQFLPENRRLRDGLGEAALPLSSAVFPLPLVWPAV